MSRVFLLDPLCFQSNQHPRIERRKRNDNFRKTKMTEFDRLPTESPFSQSVSREGKTVRIDIYEDGDGCWLLEVVDGFGNSTVWDDSFSSDREALDEALKSIDEDGIDSLIGSPPDSDWEENLNLGLSDDELEELDEFLADGTLQETSMDVSTLEGY